MATTTATTGSDTLLYSERFVVQDINFNKNAKPEEDPNPKKYDRVSRLSLISTEADQAMTVTLDVNTELYPVTRGQNLVLALASTLNLDGEKEDDSRGWRDVGNGNGSIADDYDYVCHGKVYRFEDSEAETIKVYISFGGLLLYMEGPYRRLTPLRIDYVYLLIK